MSVFNMSEEEKAAIRKQHEEATSKIRQKIADEKAGIEFKKPDGKKPKEKPKEKK